MEAGVLAKVLHDFLTTVDGELSLCKGSYFLVHEVLDKHWCYGQSHNQIGKFPTNRLHKIEIPQINDNEVLFISIAPYQGEQPGDLSFNENEIIIGIPEASSGWYTGYCNSKQGIFPASFVWQVDLSILKKQTKKKIVKKKAKVHTNMQAQLEEELDLKKSEIITVIEVLDDGWCRGITEDGKTGIFPESFITYLEVPSAEEADGSQSNNNIPPASILPKEFYKDFGENFDSQNSHIYNDPSPSYEDLFPNNSVSANIYPYINGSSEISSPPEKPYAISLYAFNAQFPNELSFKTNQVIELIKYIDTEWLEGTYDNKKGIFPVSYVNVIVDCSDVSSDAANNDTKSQDLYLPNDSKVKVEFTFVGQMSGDLTVNEGEIVTVVEMKNSDWVTVQNELGEVGLCPRNYLTSNFDNDNSEEIFHDAVDDFVVMRRKDKDIEVVEADTNKRLSEPHRPAPPAPTSSCLTLKGQNRPMEESQINADQLQQKKADQRQNVITELYLTEKDYLRDLKLTYETFNLENPKLLRSFGVDVPILFGNIKEIIEIAEELLDLIQRSMKGVDEEFQTIGPCFLKMSENMRIAYGNYCSNHEQALTLLQKYQENKDVSKIFDKGIETLKMQVACFDMNSVLIKPVQRILRYPLILNELLKCTDDNHPDKPNIQNAWSVMTDVANYINEYKRKKELASKYLHSDNTFKGRMANINRHSVDKKIYRLGAKLSASLGLTNLPQDPKFEELEREFFSLDKTAKLLIKDVEQCIIFLDDETLCGEVLSEQLNQYYQGVPNDEVATLCRIRSILRKQFLPDFKKIVKRRVTDPLNILLNFLSGPAYLINKRRDKMLDYDSAIARKDKGIIPDELSSTKSNFESLNQQLMDELPILIDASTSILYDCINAFTCARKLFNGKIMKQYIFISESSKISIEEPFESFLVQHNLLYNQITRFSSTSSKPKEDELNDNGIQSEVHKNTLKRKYSPNKLYLVKKSVSSSLPCDLSVNKGTLVGVIKNQDPMGNTSRWFVDNGINQGFIESQYLELSEEGKLIEDSSLKSSIENSVDLMSLDSPIKEVKSNSNNQSLLYSNLLEETNLLYENIDNIDAKENQTEFVYALYDFDGRNIPGTLPVKAGQSLKILKKHDEKFNKDWFLVESRDGGKGYVPHNYVGPAESLKD